LIKVIIKEISGVNSATEALRAEIILMQSFVTKSDQAAGFTMCWFFTVVGP
jgi:hypothetical protein